MSTDVQPTLPPETARPGLTPGRVGTELAHLFKLLAILALATVWVLIWGALAIASAGTEGLLKGLILGGYTVFPVFAYFGWRLYRGVTSR